MKSASKDKVYKSPVKKLARFFEKSRDQWKAKYSEAKTTIVYLRNRVQSLEKSRDHWKRQAQEATEKLKGYEEQTQKNRPSRRL
jgi:gas vesicle protein